ncbi:MAG TPA: hypothetical protein VHV31_14860, partial [Nitrolancea sp.]|nr:hypothetical protein [Nitrolancea sp.]
MFLRKRQREEVPADQISGKGVDDRLRRFVSISSPDGAEFERLIWTNGRNEPFHFVPASFQLSVDVAEWRSSFPLFDVIELELPPGWVTDRPTWRGCVDSLRRLDWIVTPSGPPDRFSEQIRLKARSGGTVRRSMEISLPIALHGVSQFDPRVHALSKANDAADWGRVEPHADMFERTFPLAIFPRALFS